MLPTRRILFAASLFACGGPGPEFVALPAAPTGTVAVLTAVERGTLVEVEAYTFEAWSEGVRVSAMAGDVLHLLFYAEPLEVLGLGAGRLGPAAADACAKRPLPPPAARQLLVLGQSPPAFSPAEGLPKSLESFEVEVPCPCVELEVEPVALGALGDARTLHARGEHLRLLTHRGIFELDAALRVVSSSVGLAANWMADAGDAGSLLVADGGALYAWSPEGRLRLLLRDPSLDDLERLVRGPRGDSWLVVSRNGLLRWREGEVGFELLRPAQAAFMSRQLDAITTIPGRVSVVSLYRNMGLLAAREDPLSIEELPWGSELNPVEVLAYIEGLGLIMGVRSNLVFRSEDEARTWLEITPTASDRLLHGIGGVVPWGDGFLELGRGGVRQYGRHSGYCPAVRWPEAHELRTGLVRPDGSLVVAGRLEESRGGTETPIFVLRPRARTD